MAGPLPPPLLMELFCGFPSVGDVPTKHPSELVPFTLPHLYIETCIFMLLYIFYSIFIIR